MPKYVCFSIKNYHDNIASVPNNRGHKLGKKKKQKTKKNKKKKMATTPLLWLWFAYHDKGLVSLFIVILLFPTDDPCSY